MANMISVCLECDREFPESCVWCDDCDKEVFAKVPENAGFGTFEIRTSCNHCGNPLMLSGPMRSASCQSCQRSVELPSAIWRHFFESLEEDYHLFRWGSSRDSTMMTEGFTFKLTYGKQIPSCHQCHKRMPSDIEVGDDRTHECVRCKSKLQTFPTPAWLKSEIPSVLQFYSAERDSEDTPENAIEVPDTINPVVMSCPKCDGALTLDGHSERTTKCEFCGVDVFLPDALWLRLHPVKTVRRFTLRFERAPKLEQLPVPELAAPSTLASSPPAPQSIQQEPHETKSKSGIVVMALLLALAALGAGWAMTQ